MPGDSFFVFVWVSARVSEQCSGVTRRAIDRAAPRATLPAAAAHGKSALRRAARFASSGVVPPGKLPVAGRVGFWEWRLWPSVCVGSATGLPRLGRAW